MSEQIRVELVVSSASLTPEELARAIGLPFDRCWRVGERRGKSTIVEKDSGWTVGVRLRSDRDPQWEINRVLADSIERVLASVAPVAANVHALAADHPVELSIVAYSPHVPALHFEHRTIEAIVRLGASLDIDLIMV